MTCSPLISLSDEELVRSYTHDGREDAIAVLYTRYARRLLTYGIARLGDREDAQDLVQAVWEAILTWRGLSAVGATWRFEAHAFLVAKGLAVNWFQWRACVARARADLVATDGQFATGGHERGLECRYCKRKAKLHGLCDTHNHRRIRGATEEQMRAPIRGKRWTTSSRRRCT